MQRDFNDEFTQKLYQAMLALKTEEECAMFFEDILTISEIKAMAQRLEVAKYLQQHAVYSEIVKKTGASTATISRVSRCLNYGSGGYQMVLDRLKEES